MCVNTQWAGYLQQLHQYMQYQTEQILKMNKLIEDLIKDVQALKEKSSTPTEIRNEYKFDLLKVETLSGTLNIGIKHDGTAAGIGEFAVEQSMNVPVIEEESSKLYNDIKAQMTEYFNQDAYNSLQDFERKYDHPLDSFYRKCIVDDIQKQIDSRIQYYLKHNKIHEGHPEYISDMGQKIVGNVKRDIEKTFEAYIKNLPNRGVS